MSINPIHQLFDSDKGRSDKDEEASMDTLSSQKQNVLNTENTTQMNEHGSPHKKRFRPIHKSPTTPIEIMNKNRASESSSKETELYENSPGTSLSDIRPIPIWVTDSSPVKFLSLEEITNMKNCLEKMALVHEIAVDPTFCVENLQSKDPIYKSVKENMHKAFWDLLKEDLNQDPPVYERVFELLNDLKMLITEHLTSVNLINVLAIISEILDLEHIRKRFNQGSLNFIDVLQALLNVLERLCAPIRDEHVKKIKNEKDLAEIFCGIFELVEFMRIDMANFSLSQNRLFIGTYAAQIECEEFMKALEIDKNGANSTKDWFSNCLTIWLNLNPPNDHKCTELTHTDVKEVIIIFYLKLLEYSPNKSAINPIFPETLKMDELRILELNEKYTQLIFTVSSILIVCNLVGRSNLSSCFKANLKNELIVILNDLDSKNCLDKLEKVFLQCEKRAKEEIPSWEEEKSVNLRRQIFNLTDEKDSVRSLASDRIRGFIKEVLRQTGNRIQVPPGLGIIQSELAAMTSAFFKIVTHNWKAFGTFYGKILDDEFSKKTSNYNTSK